MSYEAEIDVDALLKVLSAPDRALIDVRSEGEFKEGHIPGFINLPILNNDERHIVGLTYKQEGQDQAVAKGHELLLPHRSQRVSDWAKIASQFSKPPIVTCWRGGLRSKIACQWMAESGLSPGRLRAGYKGFRTKILQNFQTPPKRIIVLGGMTGTGKTELLRHLPLPSIDLEKLAHHRGSAYGRHLKGKQPTQAQFENSLGLEINTYHHLPLILEDESAHIGSVGIPPTLKLAMKNAPLVILEESMDVRVRWISEDYVFRPLREGHTLQEVMNHLLESLAAIERRIGGLMYKNIQNLITGAFATQPLRSESHQEWIQTLLNSYYDERYQFAMDRQTRTVLCRGNRKAVIKWFQDNAGDLISDAFPWPNERPRLDTNQSSKTSEKEFPK